MATDKTRSPLRFRGHTALRYLELADVLDHVKAQATDPLTRQHALYLARGMRQNLSRAIRLLEAECLDDGTNSYEPKED